MGGLTRNHHLVLYSLGQCYTQFSKRFEDKPLEVSVSKVAFIEALLSSGLVSKTKRALYKNLETLEKKRMIVYEDKHLRFTERGYRLFNRLSRNVEPYLSHHAFWGSGVSFERKVQARLRS